MPLEIDKINLAQIRVLREEIVVGEEFHNAKGSVSGFSFGFDLDYGSNPEANLIRVKLGVRVQGKDKSQNPLDLIGNFVIDFSFVVENLEDYFKADSGTKETDEKFGAVLDAQLGAVIVGISYSTARGIVLEKTQSTYLGGVILPVVDPQKLMGVEIVKK